MNKSRFFILLLTCLVFMSLSGIVCAEDFSLLFDKGVDYYIETGDGLRFGYDWWETEKDYSDIFNGRTSTQKNKTVVSLPADEPYLIWLQKPENDFSDPFNVEVTTPQSEVFYKNLYSSYGYTNLYYDPVFNEYSDELLESICYPDIIPEMIVNPKTDLGSCQISIATNFETTDDYDSFIEVPITLRLFNNVKEGILSFYIFAFEEEDINKFINSQFNVDITISCTNLSGVTQTAKTPKPILVKENGYLSIDYKELLYGKYDYFYADLDGDNEFETDWPGDLFDITEDRSNLDLETSPSSDFTMPDGIRYTIPEDDTFTFSKATKKESIKLGNGVAGSFRLYGPIHDNGYVNGFPAYTIENNNILFTFEINKDYADTLSGWDYRLDYIKRIDGDIISFYGIQSDLLYGDILFFQTSKDGQIWSTYDHAEALMLDTRVKITMESEEDSELRSYASSYDTGYETGLHPLHLEEGYYYRIVYEYQTERDKEDKKLFGQKKDHMNYAEVYQFYISYDHEEKKTDNDQQYRLGTRVKTGENFFGVQEIGTKDKHYGWDLGYFFVTGYTEHQEINGNDVFLKNVGDEITLWFRLTQNIDKLNGNEKLKIKYDDDITDQHFELPKSYFGRGALIIRKTDYQNIVQDPVIYFNFLEADAFPFANTKVELFEEGDYEVALDYSIDKEHYRIAFTFSIRNSNCMIFPFDVVTKSELVNSSYTENGFYLDLARSRYLDINVKRVVMANGVEDIRFNRSAKDGEQYTEDGIYIITVKNKITGEQTEKRIYVGADYKQYSQN